jgi:hypothetical protein
VVSSQLTRRERERERERLPKSNLSFDRTDDSVTACNRHCACEYTCLRNKKNNKKKIVLSEDTVICLELRSKRSSNNVSNLALEPRVKLEFVQNNFLIHKSICWPTIIYLSKFIKLVRINVVCFFF